MNYPVCGMVHVKDLLLLIEKNSPRNTISEFPLADRSLRHWTNEKKNQYHKDPKVKYNLHFSTD